MLGKKMIENSPEKRKKSSHLLVFLSHHTTKRGLSLPERCCVKKKRPEPVAHKPSLARMYTTTKHFFWLPKASFKGFHVT